MSTDNPFLVQILLLWLNLALIVGLGIRLTVRAVRLRPTRGYWMSPISIFIWALLLRFMVSPWTLMHENAHGYEFLSSVFSLQGFFYHGSAYYSLMHVSALVFGQTAQTVFAVNAVLGAGSSVLIFYLAGRLFLHRGAGVFAGFLWGCWPLALRTGASESMFPLAVFAGLLAWLAWYRAWERGSLWNFLLAASAVALAVQTRPQMALWPLVLLLSLFTCSGWTERLRSPWPWLAGLWALGTSLPWMFFRLEVLGAQGVPDFLNLSPLAGLPGLLTSNNLLWDRQWTPWPILALALFGLVFLVRWRPRALPATLGGFLVLAWAVLGVQVAESSSVRLQNPMQLFVVLWAGLGCAWLASMLQRSQRWLPFAMALTLACLCMYRMDKIREILRPQQEFAFLEQRVPQLDPGCVLVVPDRFMGHGKVSTEFPDWLTQARIYEQSKVLDDRNLVDSAQCTFYYRGLSCHFHTHEENLSQDGLRSECKVLGDRYSLVALYETQLLGKPFTIFQTRPGPLTIGFYRVQERLPAERMDSPVPIAAPDGSAVP